MERRADAGVGLRAHDHESSDAKALQHLLQGGVLEGVAVALLDEWFGLGRRELGHDPPAVAPLRQLLVGVLDPDHRDPFPPGPIDEAADVGDHRVALVSTLDDAFLHVDDEERGVRSVFERGHVFTQA